jgi:CheY-like chemotaxis protein
MSMNLKQLNVLLAEDDEDDRYFFEKALKELPISARLTTFSDGEELMNSLLQNPDHLPDLLFLDINMPRKNGIECLSEITHHSKLKNLPVVMFSTTNAWDTIGLLFKSGADVYIHKPGDFAQLKEVINHSIPIALDKIYSSRKVKYILNA